jgi:hypothetical protein
MAGSDTYKGDSLRTRGDLCLRFFSSKTQVFSGVIEKSFIFEYRIIPEVRVKNNSPVNFNLSPTASHLLGFFIFKNAG